MVRKKLTTKIVNTPLAKLATKIKAEHKLALAAFRKGITHAKKCGDLLRRARAFVNRGDWIQWVERNCGFSYESSKKYIRLAEHWQEIAKTMAENGELITDASINHALTYAAKPKAALAAPPEAPQPQPDLAAPQPDLAALAAPPEPPQPQPDLAELPQPDLAAPQPDLAALAAPMTADEVEKIVKEKLTAHGIKTSVVKIMAFLIDLHLTPDDLAQRLLAYYLGPN